MPLSNYTSKVPSDRSITEITRMLAKGGARQVMQDYDESGNTSALSFSLELDGQRIAFRLPADWRPVQQIMFDLRRKNSKIPTFIMTEEHARDVAWRIIRDWVEAQMALIEIHVVTAPQVFLPYALTADGQTVFEYMTGHSQLLLGGGKS